MDHMDVIHEMVVVADILDTRGQFDLADRMERLSQFDPEGIMDPGVGMGGFDQDSDVWRAPLQTRLRRNRPSRNERQLGVGPGIMRPHQLDGDPDWVSPGERPWHVGEDIEGGNYPSEFEIVAPGYHHNDPDAPSSSYTIDRDEIAGRLVDEIRDLTGIEADSVPELMSKLVHMQYVTLRYDGDEGQMAADLDSGGGYDPEILQSAKDDVSSWVSQKFEEIEGRMQENFEEPEPDYEWDRE